MTTTTRGRILAAILILAPALLAGCSDDTTDPVDDGGGTPEPEPAYATLVYELDDSVNRSYTAADGLAWKGPFVHDPASGVITPDASATGPFPMLHDDGPVSAGGHEPDGAAAGDNVWSVEVRVVSPAADWTFTHWPIRGSVDGSDGSSLWTGAGRSFTVAAGDTGTLIVPGEFFVPTDEGCRVTFSIDDTAGATLTAADGLAWKGSFRYDAATRRLTWDGSWTGPYVMLHDDGPWTEGGHEPIDATAGDHVWSVAVWVDNASTRTYEYGAIRDSSAGSDGQWIWTGSNGTFTVTAGSTGVITAPGLTLPGDR